MAIPTTRDQFKQQILRSLGQPVIEVNVDDDQVEDRIDEALSFYADYHYDGSVKTYYKYQLTQTDLDNGYIPVPSNILGMISVLDASNMLGGGGMFNPQYQWALSELHTFTSESIVPYFMTMQRMEFLNAILNPTLPTRFNRRENRLYIDSNTSARLAEGQWLVVECYQIVSPTDMPEVWADRWLLKYAEALVGVQWGVNLTKFTGMALPGGVQFNGDAILQRYMDMKKDLEEKAEQLPVDGYIG